MRATDLAGTRRGALVLVVAALVVFAMQSLGWPVAPGRDLSAYLTVYVDFWYGDPVLPWAMLSRTPVTPLVIGGILDTGSPVLVVVFAALLFAGTVLLYARTALRFGRGPAVLVSVALLLFPGFGILFHGLSGDAVFAAGFAVWTAIAVDAALRPSVSRFALLGVATALLALIRPANQAFLVVGLLPLLLAAPWRVRLSRTVAFGGVAVALLAAWSTVNLVRYDDFTVARGGSASLPLFRAFTSDHIVGPENGPASRTLADAVERELLGEEPYRSYEIDLETFFSEGSHRMHEDLISLSDRLWGWDSDYERLGAAAWEGVRAHKWTYARGVLGDFWEELSQPLFAGREAPEAGGGATGRAGSGVGLRCAPDADRGRADPLRAHERAALDARPVDPGGVDVGDRAPRRLRRPREGGAAGRQRPAARRAVRRVPRPLVEPVARPPDGPLVEALPAALAVAPRRGRSPSPGGDRGTGGRRSHRSSAASRCSSRP